MKDEQGGTLMTKLVAWTPKMYSYLTDDGCSDKKAKGTKKYATKKETKFERYKIQQGSKST